MTSFTIADSKLDGIKDQVAIITGASAGLGLEMLRKVIKHGGKVYACDLNPLPEPEASSVPFLKADVASWDEQLAVFKAAQQKYGKIDHVVANAGVWLGTTLLEDDVDDNGNLQPPNLRTVDVNLYGVMYTVKLALHYIKKNPSGGSIIITGSAASFTNIPIPDYASTKHAQLGLMRSLRPLLYPRIPIRINLITPSWTDKAVLSPEMRAIVGDRIQSPDHVARIAVHLMVDKERHGDCVFSQEGKYLELENGEKGYQAFINNTVELIGVEGMQKLMLSQLESK